MINYLFLKISMIFLLVSIHPTRIAGARILEKDPFEMTFPLPSPYILEKERTLSRINTFMNISHHSSKCIVRAIWKMASVPKLPKRQLEFSGEFYILSFWKK